MQSKISNQLSLTIAWLVALIATVGTLYASEVWRIPVCHLCWYQRICLYPLAIILGIAAYRNDVDIIFYSLPLVIIGGIFAVYQYLEQMFPGFGPIELCGIDISCRVVHFKFLGFITIPFLSFIACLLIAILLIIAKVNSAIQNKQ